MDQLEKELELKEIRKDVAAVCELMQRLIERIDEQQKVIDAFKVRYRHELEKKLEQST